MKQELLLLGMIYCTVSGADEFRCPSELTQEQLAEIVSRARATQSDLPPLISGRVDAGRRRGVCTHYYREVKLPSSAVTWNVFEIDALGEIMEWRQEENGRSKYHPENHDQLLGTGSVGFE